LSRSDAYATVTVSPVTGDVAPAVERAGWDRNGDPERKAAMTGSRLDARALRAMEDDDGGAAAGGVPEPPDGHVAAKAGSHDVGGPDPVADPGADPVGHPVAAARHLRRRWVRTLAAPLVAAILLASCGTDEDGGGAASDVTTVEAADPEPVRGGSVVVGVAGEVDGYLPSSSRFSPAGFVGARAVFDPLMIADPSGDPVPYLADSMTPNEDFTSWTLGLREGVSFHDGLPLDADALQVHFDAGVAAHVAGAARRR
jgi:hypothetical protein